MSGPRLVELTQVGGKRIAINPACVQAVFETIYPYAESAEQKPCVGLMMMFGGSSWAPVYYIDGSYEAVAGQLGLPVVDRPPPPTPAPGPTLPPGMPL